MALQSAATWMMLRSGRRRTLIATATLLIFAVFFCAYLMEYSRIQRRVPQGFAVYVELSAIVWMGCLVGLVFGALLWRSATTFRPERRAFFQTAGAVVAAAPIAAFTFGYIERERFRVVEIDVPIAGLPKGLNGLRLLQVTDVHLSRFLSEREFARAIDMANETRPHVVLMTGDLITMWGDPVDACLRQLARLRSDTLTLGCLGNHEIYAGVQDYVAEAGMKLGMDFLRQRNRLLTFGGAKINFAGVDYQKMHTQYLPGAERLVEPDAFNVLLSHNPDVFPVAAAKGFPLTIGGHTHGGQVNVEILDENVNAARYFTPFTRGLYTRENASIYVSSGVGTIGIPVRIGAPPEISVIRLCAT